MMVNEHQPGPIQEPERALIQVRDQVQFNQLTVSINNQLIN